MRREKREGGNKWTKSEIDEGAKRQDGLTHCRANVEERRGAGRGGGEMEESETDRQVREGFVLFACAGAPRGSGSARQAKSTKDNT